MFGWSAHKNHKVVPCIHCCCTSCKARLPVSLWAWTYDLGSSGPRSQSLCYAKLLKSGIQVWMLLHICFLAIQVMVFSIYVLFLYSADTNEYFLKGENFCTTEIHIIFVHSLYVGFRIIGQPLEMSKNKILTVRLLLVLDLHLRSHFQPWGRVLKSFLDSLI